MSNYVKAVDYSAKDALASGNPNKIIKGTELNDEFNAIATAVATKADLASPAFLGNPTAVTQPSGNSSSRLATTAFVQQEINANEANVAITGGTIAGVAITGLATDLAIADGGTGASSITLNSVILGNNAGALDGNLVAPSTSGNVLKSNGTTWVSAANPSLGVGQTWQNVTGSRTANTTYTNNTGAPIFVSIQVKTSATTTDFNFFINDIQIQAFDNAATNNFDVVCYCIVPAGDTYKITVGNSISAWWELR